MIYFAKAFATFSLQGDITPNNTYKLTNLMKQNTLSTTVGASAPQSTTMSFVITNKGLVLGRGGGWCQQWNLKWNTMYNAQIP